MRSLRAISLVLLTAVACGGGGSNEPSVPIVSANGTISIGGRKVVPAYGVAGSGQSGTSVGVVLSDAPMGCSALTDEYSGSHIPKAGTYMAVAFPSFDKGVAAHSFVDFTVISGNGSVDGSGSSASKVEVLDVTDTSVTIKVEYREALSMGDCLVSGDFTATRCPLPAP